MSDRIFKFGAVSVLLTFGVALLPTPQNGQYKYIADGIALFDARTGAVIEQDLDSVLPKQYQRMPAVNQREALADCRSSMEITVAQRKRELRGHATSILEHRRNPPPELPQLPVTEARVQGPRHMPILRTHM